MNNKLNLFVTFEGGEGSGKSSAAKLVKEKLINENIDVFLTREPGGKGVPFAEDIRKVIMDHDDIDLITELLLFEASRREHLVKKIVPALNDGKLVISDRFEDSTIVYQGIVKGVDIETIHNANKIARGDYSPSLVFVFDLDPIIGLERISNGNRGTNRFDNEGIEFHKKIRNGYLSLAKTDNKKYIIVDATKTLDEVSDFIIKKIKEYGNQIN